MKRIIAIISCAVALCSCNLDEVLYTYVDENTYIENASTARNVLYGVYREMSANSLYGYYLSIIYDLPTDIAKVDGNSITNNRDICVNAHSADHAFVRGTWQQAYRVIYYANDFMEKTTAAMSRIPEKEHTLVDLYLAEARGIRALMYFELVRLFGGVTLMTDTKSSFNHPSTFKRNSATEIYEFVTRELEEVAEILPWADEDTVRTDNSFAFSRGGALGLLARAYATWAGYPLQDQSKWAKCEAVCKRIIDEGHHSLLPNYEQLWKNVCNGVWDPTESMMQISFYSPTISTSSQNCSGYIGKWNGVHVVTNSSRLVRVDARYRALPTFMSKWKDYDKDLRWGLSAVNYSYDGLTKVPMCTYNNKEIPFELSLQGGAPSVYRDAYKNGLYVAKYDLTKYVDPDKQLADGNYSNAHWYLVRYADILLLYAEALNELGAAPSEDAYAAVNAVRRRGFGLPSDDDTKIADLPEGLTREQFRQALRDERAYELCFEGQRKQDLIRWGIYYETVMNTYVELEDWRENFSKYYIGGEYTIKGKHELLPIPQAELDIMTSYERNNPGWE